jgi:DMSO reductase family type II enzyme heme b subunit
MGLSTAEKVHGMGRRIGYRAAIGLLALANFIGCQRPTNKATQEGLTTESSNDAKPTSTAAPDAAANTNSGKQLFARHCAPCHGERGDGKGVAAAFLFPKPRDLRAGRFRLTSTSNNVPTREDLNTVLIRGMPGSAMPSWAHLSQSERDALIDEIMSIRRDGAREYDIKLIKEQDELTDEQIAADDVQKDIADYVKDFTMPGDGADVPAIGPPSTEAIARGRDVYATKGCIQCHGKEGKGDAAAPMVDAEGMPTRPRDFTLGIFKGSPEPASLYRRIAYGMPGTPMPASGGMTPDQMVDLVHFVRSLSTEEQRQSAVLKREKIVAARVAILPDAESATAWDAVKPVRLAVTPLWWRSDSDVELAVQAVHDGKILAIRMTWRDPTNDHQPVRTESFKDGAAMELYRGPAEPFLGMGSPLAPVDLWFWDSDRQDSLATIEDVHPNAVTDVYPFSEHAVESAELTRAGARTADQPDISLPARAVGNQVVPMPGQSGGTLLGAIGPGTLTFFIPKSQSVAAHGTWSYGGWSIVMRRPLALASGDDGVPLEPGARASVAFAVWDGSHRDRDGQKLITIWQDLELAK